MVGLSITHKDDRTEYYLGNDMIGYLDKHSCLYGIRHGYAVKIDQIDHADNPVDLLRQWRKPE